MRHGDRHRVIEIGASAGAAMVALLALRWLAGAAGLLRPAGPADGDGDLVAGQHTWLAYLPALAVCAGAVAGGLLARRAAPVLSWRRAALLAGAAAVTVLYGVVLLSWYGPAGPFGRFGLDLNGPLTQDAKRAFLLGTVLAAPVGLALVLSRPLRANAAITAGWVGLLVVWSRASGATGAPRLGVPESPWPRLWWGSGPASYLLLVPPLAIAVLVALRAARAGQRRALVALSGAAGPVLVLIAYRLGGPGTGDHVAQLLPYLVAHLAVPVGLAGSVLVALAVPRPAVPAPEAVGAATP